MKKKYVIIPVFIILGGAGAAGIYYTKQGKVSENQASGCPVTFNLFPRAHAALPPQSPDELSAESQLVVQGEVCNIVKTYTDGDERRERADKEHGKGNWVGGGTYNSQDVVIRLESVNKGNTNKKELQVRKPISAYRLDEGDKGTFYINTNSLSNATLDGTLVGEYWPVTQ